MYFIFQRQYKKYHLRFDLEYEIVYLLFTMLKDQSNYIALVL